MAESVNHPKISILIPNKDHRELLEPCVESIFELTTYPGYEIIIIENNSTQGDIFAYYDALEHPEYRYKDRVRVLRYPNQGFNYQKLINYGAENCAGEYILQLNNDTKLLTPNWLELLLDVAKQENTGAVGAALYYPDMTVQHLGGILYLKDSSVLMYEHAGLKINRDEPYKPAYMTQARPVTWVTGACLFMRKSLYMQLGGMDETFEEICGDMDLCLKAAAAGYRNMICPHAELLHFESKTRGYYTTREGQRKADREINIFIDKWRDMLGDKDPFTPPGAEGSGAGSPGAVRIANEGDRDEVKRDDGDEDDNMKQQVTIEAIMSDIKKTAAQMAKSNAGAPPVTGAVNIDRLFSIQSEIRSCIYTMMRTKDCTAIKPVVTHRGLLRPVDLFFKRLIRKTMLWLIEPAWQEQKIFNNALVTAVSRLTEINEELLKGIAECAAHSAMRNDGEG